MKRENEIRRKIEKKLTKAIQIIENTFFVNIYKCLNFPFEIQCVDFTMRQLLTRHLVRLSSQLPMANSTLDKRPNARIWR